MARLVGGLDAFHGPMQALPPAAAVAHEVDVARVREALGDEAFSEARKDGQALALEETIAEGLALADTLMRCADLTRESWSDVAIPLDDRHESI